jgi:hypothetical protein
MACTLYRKEDENIIQIKDLKTGALAIVVEGMHKGKIIWKVQFQNESVCYILGNIKGDFFRGKSDLKVRELNPGELIKVDYSE